MSRPSLFARFTDNALAGVGAAVVSSPLPMTSYSANTLLQHRPTARVLYGLPSPNSVHLAFDWSVAQQLDLFVLPVSNAFDGTIRLTTDAGFDQTFGTSPTLRPSGMSATFVADLALLDTNTGHRTTTGADLYIDSNTDPLVLGGFIGLYGPKRPFIDRDFQWGISRQPIGYATEAVSDRGTDLVYPYRTQANVYTLTTIASEDDADAIDAWIDANFVGGYPAFLWVDPDGRNIPLVCRLEGSPQIVTMYDGAIQITLTVKELSKGKPVA